MSEIQQALAQHHGRLDVIGFDAALAGMLENAYALRDCGSIMVASEDVQPGDEMTVCRIVAADGADELSLWRRWRLELLRVGTRETTAILYLNNGGRMKEQARLNWDSTGHEPDKVRAGIGFSSAGAAATVLLDELWLTESELSS